MVSLRQLRCFIAVYEERSFTAAAEREAATQSGVSQHVRQLEGELGAPLFERLGRDVRPTPTGDRYYDECIGILRRLDAATREASVKASERVGRIRVGLMPSFTRCALAPALLRFTEEAPKVEVQIVEAYSAVLTERVRAGELDFAVVPAFEGATGLTLTHLTRDRELLVSRAGKVRKNHLRPVRLKDIAPLKIVVPGTANTRRRTIETYFAVNKIEVARRMELDAMFGTLDFVGRSDWVAILPSVILVNDRAGTRFEIRPIAQPPLHSDFVLIEPARQEMSEGARLFADMLAAETRRIGKLWDESIAAAR